jgi:hypothetical protein
MKVGNVIFTTNIKARVPDAEFSFRAPNGEMFVFLFLGTTKKYPPMSKPLPADFAPFDANAALNELGWEFNDEK